MTTGTFSLTTLRACETGARELGLSMRVTVRLVAAGPHAPREVTGVVVGIGSKLGLQVDGDLIEDIPPGWVTGIDIGPATTSPGAPLEAPSSPSRATVPYLLTRYSKAYTTAIECAADLYRTLVTAGGNGDPFWTTKAETDTRQRQQLEGMVTVAVAILKALPHQQMRTHTALQTVKDHIRDLAREESH